jgi:outer membrane protein OmpA-like peptidoglycan-associated protein
VHLNARGRQLLDDSLRYVSVTMKATARTTSDQVVRSAVSGWLVQPIQTLSTPAGSFVPGSSRLTMVGTTFIKSLAAKLGQVRRIVLTGYTANYGLGVTLEANALSMARAQAVRAELEHDGIKVSFQTLSGATRDPISSNSTASGRARNRRTAIEIVHTA